MIESLVWSTDIDVLPAERTLARREGYWVVSSPSNPGHWWGNFVVFETPPGAGDGSRWEEVFAAEFPQPTGVGHRTFAWDRTDGSEGSAHDELVARGYELERSVGLLAAPDELHPHPRANVEVTVRALTPDQDADEPRWRQVIDLQVAGRDQDDGPADEYELFAIQRQRDIRRLLLAGRGQWFVALDGDLVVGSLGVIVTDRRARYQHVDTLESHRRRGICSRLVLEAAQRITAEHQVDRFVIVADPDYHAFGLYESLGFRLVERVCGALKLPHRAAA